MKIMVPVRKNTGSWIAEPEWYTDAFRSVFSEVAEFKIPYRQTHTYSPYPSAEEVLTYRLKKFIEREKPDACFVIHGGGIWNSSHFRLMKKMGVFVIYYNPDDPMLFGEISMKLAPHSSLNLAFPKAVPLYRELAGVEAMPFFYCTDPEVAELKGEKERDIDILFTGNLNSKSKSRRREIIEELVKSFGDKMHVYGPMPDETEKISSFWKGEIKNNREHAEILRRARIVIHYTQETDSNEKQIELCGDNMQSVSGRVFDATASGCLLMTNYFEDLYSAYSEDEVVVYNDTKDLISKIEYYLSNENERAMIADKGKVKAVKSHSVISRAEYIRAEITAAMLRR